MANSAIATASVTLDGALSGVPKPFRLRIIKDFTEIRTRYTQAIYSDTAYDAIGLSAGKYCETLLRFLQDKLTGTHIPFGSQIRNFNDQCKALEQAPATSGVESLRILIPRCLNFVYTVRNKRGIGHTGGDVEANKTDIITIVNSVTWMTCELIRVFYGGSLEDAQGLVDALNTRKLPEIWEVMGKKRVLRTDLPAKDRVLVLCYSTPNEAILIEDLFDWVEYSNLSVFRRTVIGPLHKEKLVEHNKELDAILISPLGVKRVEEHIININS